MCASVSLSGRWVRAPGFVPKQLEPLATHDPWGWGRHLVSPGGTFAKHEVSGLPLAAACAGAAAQVSSATAWLEADSERW